MCCHSLGSGHDKSPGASPAARVEAPPIFLHLPCDGLTTRAFSLCVMGTVLEGRGVWVLQACGPHWGGRLTLSESPGLAPCQALHVGCHLILA